MRARPPEPSVPNPDASGRTPGRRARSGAERRLQSRQFRRGIQRPAVLAVRRRLCVEPLDRAVRLRDDALERTAQPRAGQRRRARGSGPRQQHLPLRRGDRGPPCPPRSTAARRRHCATPGTRARAPRPPSRRRAGAARPGRAARRKRPSSIASRICRSTMLSHVGPTEILPSPSRRFGHHARIVAGP